MSSHQIEINSMLLKLNEWNKELGGNSAKKMGDSEFDFLQEEFLSKRYQVQKAQDIRQQEGFTTANAGIGVQIRDGLTKMRELAEKLKDQQKRLVKKKKDPPEILERKLKIVQNCELLLQDLQERENEGGPKKKYQAVTLTEMKAKLLEQIQQNNEFIHEKRDSDGILTEDLEGDRQQISKWKKKDAELDDIIADDIIVGVKRLKDKVKNINEAQDVINQKTGKTGAKVDKLSTRIQGDNQKLKKIIEDFKPNRCCLYVALFLLLVGLIVCVIKLLI